MTELRKPSKQSCPICNRRVSALPAPRGRWQLVTHRPLGHADRKRVIACVGSGGLVGKLAPRTEPAQEALFATPPPPGSRLKARALPGLAARHAA